MATPVPVVSMMYFLVSMPPKMLDAVNPAFSAMSVKWATEGAFVAATGVCTWQRQGTLDKNSDERSAKPKPRKTAGKGRFMTSGNAMDLFSAGQACLGKLSSAGAKPAPSARASGQA